MGTGFFRGVNLRTILINPRRALNLSGVFHIYASENCIYKFLALKTYNRNQTNDNFRATFTYRYAKIWTTK